MRIISGLLRILLGLGVAGFAASIYLVHQGELAGDKPVTVSLVGQEIDAEPQAIIIGIAAAALIGLLLAVAGIVTLVRRSPAPATAGSTTEEKSPAR